MLLCSSIIENLFRLRQCVRFLTPAPSTIRILDQVSRSVGLKDANTLAHEVVWLIWIREHTYMGLEKLEDLFLSPLLILALHQRDHRLPHSQPSGR